MLSLLIKKEKDGRTSLCIANACRVLPLEKMEAAAPGSSLCRSLIRSPTLISMGLRKNRHFSFLDGNGTSRTKRPYLYFKDTSATQRGRGNLVFSPRRAAECPVGVWFHVGVVREYYHWMVGVYCRKELGNFQVEAASAEPEQRKKHREAGGY